MAKIDFKIKTIKNLGKVQTEDLKKFKEFYKKLLKSAHRMGTKNPLICLEKSKRFLRYRFEKLSNYIQKRLIFEGLYLKQFLRAPNSWIIYYFACKYNVYFTRPHKRLFERISVKNKISKRINLNLSSNHLIVPATIRPYREEIKFNLPALAKKLSHQEIYVAVHFLKNKKVFIERIPFGPSKMRVDGKQISIPIVKTPEKFLKTRKSNIELILNLDEYNLEKKETILDNDAKKLYIKLKPFAEISEYRLTYMLGQGDLEIKYKGENIKIELSRMDFNKIRNSMATKLIVGKIAINCLKSPEYIHIFIFHKKNKKIIEGLNDIINHFQPIIIFSDFKNFNELSKEILNRLKSSIPKVHQ